MRHQLPFMLFLAAPVVACVDQGSTDDATQVASALEKSDGGYTRADEAPMFAADSEYSAAAIESDAATTDAMASDPGVTSIDNATTTDGRDLIVLWGRIPGDPNAQDARDWSGQLALSRGALV